MTSRAATATRRSASSSKKFPGLAAKDLSYSWQDLRELDYFAKVRHHHHARDLHARPCQRPAELLAGTRNPELNTSSLDVSNPRTAVLMKALLEEMIPLFDAPYFHIGTDEYRMAG